MQKQEQNTKTMSPDSNEALCIRIQQGDEQAKSQLLQQNEGMIHAVAWRERRRYAYLALELEDLWAAGQLGMLRAARLFRPETGNQFATYAWPHVRQAIQREIISGGTIIRIPVHLHDRMHKLSVYREPNGSVNYEALAERVTAEERTGHGMTASEIKEFLCRVEPMVSLRSLNEMLKLDGETPAIEGSFFAIEGCGAALWRVTIEVKHGVAVHFDIRGLFQRHIVESANCVIFILCRDGDTVHCCVARFVRHHDIDA